MEDRSFATEKINEGPFKAKYLMICPFILPSLPRRIAGNGPMLVSIYSSEVIYVRPMHNIPRHVYNNTSKPFSK
ncbi:MAG: hypothetical protein AUH71_05480 [Thaumarchaeota archaeon 13_1_40CM_4_48_7]|nr:MAG: hypothetical protein AUH71_05480 [Thaumarchaeota archaeon 13_1_40CM_4_48_7]